MKVCFAHVPKCSGTSITSFFRSHFGDRAFDGLTTLDYARASDEALAHFEYFSGHSYHHDRQRIPTSTRLFTVMREPTARVVSLKQYWGHSVKIDTFEDADDNIRQAMQIARHASVPEFIQSSNPFIHQEITNGLIRQIIPLDVLYRNDGPEILSCFCDELSRYHSVMTVERLSESFPLMIDALGLPGAPLGRENVSVQSEHSFDEVRQLLYLRSPLDYAAYEIARSIENEQIKDRHFRQHHSEREAMNS